MALKNLFKKWYVHETNWLFVPHTMAYDRVWGPMTRREALESALWHANQRIWQLHDPGDDTYVECLTYSVNTEREAETWQ